MTEKKDALVQRVQDSFRQLPVVATSLNAVSDKLNASVNRLELALKKHPIGVSSWVHFSERETQDRMGYWYSDVGYTKINGKWDSQSATSKATKGLTMKKGTNGRSTRPHVRSASKRWQKFRNSWKSSSKTGPR